MSIIDQKEYLKKYLSLGDEKEKNKKRKKRAKIIRNRVNIIDDDIDLPTNFDEVELKEFLTAEDAPQVVGMVDDRPLALRIDDYRKSDKWKLVGSDDELKEPENTSKNNSSNIKVKLNKNKDRKIDHSDSDASPVRTKRKSNIGSPPRNSRNNYDSDVSPQRKSRNNYDSDASPPRKSKKHYDSDTSPPRKSRTYDADATRKSRRNEDLLPPKKIKNEDLDARTSRRNDDLDKSPPRKPRKQADSDPSPPRKSRKNEDADCRTSRRNDLDASPHRKPRKKADTDTSPPRKSRRNDDLDVSPPRKPRKKVDSDTSPPRKSRKNEDADASPPRKSRRNASPITQSNKYDRSSPPRSKRTRQSRFSDINEATTSTQKNDKYTDKTKNNSGSSPVRKANKYNDKSNSNSRKMPNNNVADLKKMTKTLDGKTAGLQYGGEFKKETAVLKKREDEMFENMSAEISGKDAAPIMRDRKTGKIRDLEKEAIAEYEKQQKENVQKEKYDKWGKGLKQVEQHREKVAEELHEMSKPLARYANDEDLEKYLKDQEREGDPMLQYIRKKKRKLAVASGDPVALKPQYDGDFIPNRFGIPPGFRWDGVDRSCGYEKQWFEVQNSKKAVEEEVYKWSTEDM